WEGCTDARGTVLLLRRVLCGPPAERTDRGRVGGGGLDLAPAAHRSPSCRQSARRAGPDQDRSLEALRRDAPDGPARASRAAGREPAAEYLYLPEPHRWAAEHHQPPRARVVARAPARGSSLPYDFTVLDHLCD